MYLIAISLKYVHRNMQAFYHMYSLHQGHATFFRCRPPIVSGMAICISSSLHILVYLVFDEKRTGIPHISYILVYQFFGPPVIVLWTPGFHLYPAGKPWSTLYIQTHIILIILDIKLLTEGKEE